MSKKIIPLVVVSILITGSIAFYYYVYHVRNPDKVDTFEGSLEDFSPDTKPNKDTTSDSTTQSKDPSEILNIDDNWSRYINNDYGFSIDIPKNAISFYGSCTYSTSNGDHSYRPQSLPVPLQMLENGNSVYVTTDYLYELGGETVSDNRHYYSTCNKRTINASYVTSTPRSEYLSPILEIKFARTENDSEIEEYIKDNYGENCTLEEKLDKEGYQAIVIGGISMDFDSGCYINYMHTLRYNQINHTLVSWNLGQACNFPYPTQMDCQDQILSDSFKFL